jgi:NADH dehydrogenase
MTSDWELSRKINVEATRQLAEAANKAGVARFVYISSQSAHEKNNSPYGQTKLEGEKALKDTEIAYTILRPGVIYGPEKRGIFAKLEDQLRKLPAIPLIGDGKYKQYPVHVDDVAWAVLETTTHDNCVNKTYDIAGQEPIEFRNLIKHLLNKLKLKKAVIPLPIWFCRILATFGGLVMKNPPINHSNIEGLLTAPPLDISSAQRDFNYQPRALE